MKIRVLGAGWYGAHLSLALLEAGHQVECFDDVGVFAGASGANPARLHLGWHYPRSKLTRAGCQEHQTAFLTRYGQFTRSVPVNIYAVAANESMLDFGTYLQAVGSELQHIVLHNPAEFGLAKVEGAVLTGERHIVIDEVRAFFQRELTARGALHISERPKGAADLTIDCTFCARDGANVDRYEPCITALVKGPTDKAITIMDGPFPSLYPWNEAQGLCSLTSAKYTPLGRYATREEAEEALKAATEFDLEERADAMAAQFSHFYPAFWREYEVVDWRLGIRAMPKSGADARLVDVVRVDDRTLRVRAGKIDAVVYAEQLVKEMIA
jgi:hypothetical protein